MGDLIVVTLGIKVHKGNRYLALEDPLPSVFEPVNPEFATQNQRNDGKAQDNVWTCDHRELRKGGRKRAKAVVMLRQARTLGGCMHRPAHHGANDQGSAGVGRRHPAFGHERARQ